MIPPMLTAIQIAIAVVLIVLILLQERSAGLSGLMGGDGIGFYQTRRGLEKMVFWGTVVFSAAFVAVALLQIGR